MLYRPVPPPASGATGPAGATRPAALDRRAALLGGVVLGVLGALAIGLVALVWLGRGGAFAGPTPAPDAAAFAYGDMHEAPPLELTDQDGAPFSLASLRGRPTFVFFGYTHCPDVCPATIGTLNQVLADVGDGPRAVFVSIDPERDDVAAMKTYLRYLPTAYRGLSGTPEQVAGNANRWGVKYAKVDEGSPGGYAMSHTADLFLVDAQGRLRARFPFGTAPAPIEAALRALVAETPLPSGETQPSQAASPPASPMLSASPSGSASPSATARVADLRVLLVSSSVWAGPQTPVIVTLTAPDGTPLDGSVPVSARVIGANDTPTGPDVPVTAILPAGAKRASFVATVQIPVPGWWRLDLLVADGRRGSVAIEALDPGSTTPIGAPAPDIDTPTLADVGDDPLAITTQEAPDLRFYRESTADARAAGRPYVIVIDSSRFRVSPACGRALVMARFLLDRWNDRVAFIHLEPFVYSVVTRSPVLQGDIANPPLNAWTAAWGLGQGVWPATDMPWLFVVDGNGVVRAKYRGVIGSADVDLILSVITGEGVLAR